MSTPHLAVGILIASLPAALGGAPDQEVDSGSTSCIACHADEELFEPEETAIVESLTTDVHAEVGLSCHDCHGGDPSPALADDMDQAMNEELDFNSYLGAPGRAETPRFCGRCHSDPAYMKRFRPDARVDQETEYATSHHGVALAQGDVNVATCIDCHGAHGIRRPADPESKVYPTNVAETCASCHADADKMRGYALPGGEPLPVDQYARWRASVHASALHDREDLSAPTCNDCHGNHGASPPGLDSVTFVCGACHGREAELFRASPKYSGFRDHNDYMGEAGDEGCAACHEAPEPQAEIVGIRNFGECTSCHNNHGTTRPTVGLFGYLPETPCSFCHERPGGFDESRTGTATGFERYRETRDRLLSEAAEAGLAGDAKFDWLVDRVRGLGYHTVAGEVDELDRPLLRPEFENLYNKFRIGKTYYTYLDPVTGEEVQEAITRCSDCHAGDSTDPDETPGAATGIDLLARMRELTASIGNAERILLRARRGGVGVRDAEIELEYAVDAQIGLEVQVHSFDAGAGSDFLETHAEGLTRVNAAIVAGQAALQEIQARRRWLAFSLVVIVVTLIALGLKIRELSMREEYGAD